MCGDVEDDGQAEDELVERLLYVARAYGVTRETLTARTEAPLVSDAGRPAYMSDLFRRVLNHAASDLATIPNGQRTETVANQAVVFARLAGFIAGQLPPGDDMTRVLLEAMLDGLSEPARTFAKMRAQDHGHDHDHDHDHEHGHHHHHH